MPGICDATFDAVAPMADPALPMASPAACAPCLMDCPASENLCLAASAIGAKDEAALSMPLLAAEPTSLDMLDMGDLFRSCINLFCGPRLPLTLLPNSNSLCPLDLLSLGFIESMLRYMDFLFSCSFALSGSGSSKDGRVGFVCAA